MRSRRPVAMAMLSAGWILGPTIGLTGCDSAVPPTGTRAIVAADHLEQQRARLEQIRSSMKTRPSSKAFARQ